MVDAVGNENMYEQLANFKPTCKMFNTSVGCKNGRKCKDRHCKGDGQVDAATSCANTAYMMDVSADDNGNQVLVPRTPFKEALEALFAEHRTVRQAGRQHVHLRLELAFLVAWVFCKLFGSIACA
jgi:hypothetical protein